MMSPDPPRPESDDGVNPNPDDATFFANFDEMDVPDDAVYELDFTPESDDDDDEEESGPEMELEPNDGEPRIRARYQLLIPFPTATGSAEENQEEVEFRHSVISNSDATANTGLEQAVETLEITAQEPPPKPREINLTPESAEAIKSVMKGISLPPTAIPEWAKEISEDAWKSKILAKMEKKNSSTNSDSRPHNSRKT